MNETADFLPRPQARGSYPSAHFSGTQSQLHQLKRKLLRAALEETPETGSFKRLCGVANQAEDLAWATMLDPYYPARP